ncbi:ankyrin [Aspergillus sclerotioniger CBS 115572]|uniref:Ankyrin n=1 Tax=Aspergillus sclerotioniger CBS 115572 TaxID=1450535 RepID=A0A317V5N6_9EURO|nr:ankyrin [Aspergillus sclerotioniger CBS 115572]PWY69624.1 ankyrin [Aspergillus sclerotioniger CBS 115572]
MESQTPLHHPGAIFQLPGGTPREIVVKAKELCISNDIQRFRELLDSAPSEAEHFTITDFGVVMCQAVEQDRVPFIQALLDRGFPLDPCYARIATRHQSKKTLALWMENGWDINAPMCGTEPSVLGIAVNDESMAVWLLDNGADPNKRTFMDVTPLSWAVEWGSISVIKAMLDRTTDIHAGQVLHHAARRASDTIQVLEMLIEKGAPLNTPMYQDSNTVSMQCFMSLGTPLHTAAELGNLDVVRLLLSKGADPTVKDYQGKTVIELARRMNRLEVVEVLEKDKKKEKQKEEKEKEGEEKGE